MRHDIAHGARVSSGPVVGSIATTDAERVAPSSTAISPEPRKRPRVTSTACYCLGTDEDLVVDHHQQRFAGIALLPDVLALVIDARSARSDEPGQHVVVQPSEQIGARRTCTAIAPMCPGSSSHRRRARAHPTTLSRCSPRQRATDGCAHVREQQCRCRLSPR